MIRIQHFVSVVAGIILLAACDSPQQAHEVKEPVDSQELAQRIVLYCAGSWRADPDLTQRVHEDIEQIRSEWGDDYPELYRVNFPVPFIERELIVSFAGREAQNARYYSFPFLDSLNQCFAISRFGNAVGSGDVVWIKFMTDSLYNPMAMAQAYRSVEGVFGASPNYIGMFDWYFIHTIEFEHSDDQRAYLLRYFRVNNEDDTVVDEYWCFRSWNGAVSLIGTTMNHVNREVWLASIRHTFGFHDPFGIEN